MSLWKRGGVWWSYLYRAGIRHQYSTGTANRRQAEIIETRLREELNRQRFGVIETNPKMLFRELAAMFLASGSARPHHIYHLKFLLSFFADTPVLRITKSMAEEYRKERKLWKPDHPVKDATVNRDLSVLRHILYWAVDGQLLEANPLARLKLVRERKTRRQVLSVAEEQLLLGSAKNHLQGMVIAALDTGMRRGEITGQRWEDIDFSRKVLFVTRSKTPEGECREIALSDRLHTLLREHRQSEGLVFQYKDRPLRIVKRTWKTTLRNAGLRHIRFHDLRHTFNTRLMEAGVLQEVRMALMGHSTGSSVHATYTHIELPVKREAIRKLEAWKIHQEELLEQQRKEGVNVSSESNRKIDPNGTQAMAQEIAGGSSSGTGRKTESRDLGDGRGDQS